MQKYKKGMSFPNKTRENTHYLTIKTSFINKNVRKARRNMPFTTFRHHAYGTSLISVIGIFPPTYREKPFGGVIFLHYLCIVNKRKTAQHDAD